MKTRPKSYYAVPGARDFYTGNLDRVEVDPKIARAVKALNAKGYPTVASCSGHNPRPNSPANGYLWIDVRADHVYEPVPPSFVSEPSGIGTGLILRWKAKTLKGLKIEIARLEAWVEKLPARNSEGSKIRLDEMPDEIITHHKTSY